MASCAEYPTYCIICKKGPFAGVIPAQQHFKSQAHLSKQAFQNDRMQQPSGDIGARGQQTYVSSCNACGKNFNNEFSAEQHFASENHKKKQALIQSTQSNSSSFLVSTGRGCDSPELSFYSSENLAANVQLKQVWKNKSASNPKGSQNSTDQQNKNNRTQEYSFDGNRGYCNVCKIELTSPQHAKQHLNGKPHAKAKAAESSGLHHTKAVNEANTAGVHGDEYNFSGGRGYCYICKIELTSQAHAEQHLSGKNHEKAKSKGNADVQKSLPLTCEICQKTFSGPECASQHFSSVKHRQKEALVQSHNPNSPPITNQNIPAFEVSPGDKTKWVICEVCNVKLNSIEQLNIHKNSPKHIAEEEKLARMGTSIKVMNTPDFKMDAIKPRVQVQDTGFCPVNPRVDFAGLRDDVRPSLNASGPSSFLSNQPGWFAQTENITLATMPSLNVSSIIIESNQPPNQKKDNMDDTIPKEVRFENPDIQSDDIGTYMSEEKNLKEKYSEKELEKELINEKINTSSESSSLSSLEMPPLESNMITNDLELGKKNTRQIYRKANKDQENLLRKNMTPSMSNSDGPRPPGAYPYERNLNSSLSCSSSQNIDASKSSEKSYLSSANSNPIPLHQNVTNLELSMQKSNLEPSMQKLNLEPSMQKSNCTTGRSEGNMHSISLERSPSKFGDSPSGDIRKVVTSNPCVGSENISQTTTTQRVQNTGSSGSNLVKRISNTKSRGGAKSGGGSVALYGSSDSSDESDDQEEENKFFPCTSRDVFQKLQEVNGNASPTAPFSRVTEGPVNEQRVPKYYCKICQCQMNAKKAYKDHLEGRKHMQKVAVMAAEPRKHRPIVKEVHNQWKTDGDLTLWSPRSYQWELYGRAMEGDRVVFLPTGTGKTLISCMTISAMLELNPTRQALFLVDKVLLVIQQSRYLVKQIGDRLYKRFNPDDPSSLVDRKLKIAALCGGQQSTDGVPIWQHDLIVVTAAYCDQLIMKNVLRWEDLCIVVFDEAHHCIKSHPFNKQLEQYHLKMDVQERPKILGLTASPAGKKTFPMTLNMLNNLMQSMGGAKIAVTKEHKAELERYQSSAELIVNYTPMSIKEQKFQKELQLYLLTCYLRLSAETNIPEQLDLGIVPTQGSHISDDKKSMCAKELHGDILNSLEVTLNDAKPNDQSAAGKIQHRNLVAHTWNICVALNTLFETGVKTAVEELDELMARSPHGNFDYAKSINLKPDNLLSEIEIVQEMVQSSLPGLMIDPESQLSSRIVQLMKALLNPVYIDWSQTHPMVLVLVKERSSANKISAILQTQKEILEKHLKVTHLVGHGGGSGDGKGMDVSQQKKILRDIKNHKYHIVIATSVAEEGIDIPECELVITMNLPSSVTALVQMRGRARKENSKFVVLCNDKTEEDKLSELMKKEDNMIKAANFLFDSQNKQEAKEH